MSTYTTKMPDRYPASDPRAWVDHAQSDLLLAEMTPPSGVHLELLCFHAQQAAEKAIKAVIMYQTQEEAAFSHDLRRLTRDAEQAGASRVPITPERAQAMTGYAAISRYPADLGEVDEEEWSQAAEDARRVVEWAALEVGYDRR